MSPLLAVATAGLLYPVSHRVRKAAGVRSDRCLCIGEREEPVLVDASGGVVLARSGLALTIDEVGQCQQRYQGAMLGIRLHTLVDRFHRASALSLGFARGLNDTPKVLALLVAAGWSGVSPRTSLVVIAAAMALGGFLRARRVAETLSHRITTLSHGQGALANALASALVIGASLLGSPVSTTHVTTGALFGIGAWNRATNWPTVSGIVASC